MQYSMQSIYLCKSIAGSIKSHHQEYVPQLVLTAWTKAINHPHVSFAALSNPQIGPKTYNTWYDLNISKVHRLGLLWWWTLVSPLIYIWAPAALPYLPLSKYTERIQTHAFYRGEGTLVILKAGRQERPTQARSRECFFFFPPPLNIRPCIIQITLYICTLPLKLEFGVDVFSMLAHQSGIYVRLKIHILLPLIQCLKSLLVAVVSSLVWLVLQPLILSEIQ